MKSIKLLALFAAAAVAAGMAKRPPEKKMEDLSSLLVAERADGPSVWKGGNSSSPGEAVVVRDEETWNALWKEKLSAEAPPVDFSSYTALAVFLGSRNTGGYGVEFLPPAREGETVVLGWREKKPAPGGFVIQAFTQPYAIQLYRRIDGPVEARAR